MDIPVGLYRKSVISKQYLLFCNFGCFLNISMSSETTLSQMPCMIITKCNKASFFLSVFQFVQWVFPVLGRGWCILEDLTQPLWRKILLELWFLLYYSYMDCALAAYMLLFWKRWLTQVKGAAPSDRHRDLTSTPQAGAQSVAACADAEVFGGRHKLDFLLLIAANKSCQSVCICIWSRWQLLSAAAAAAAAAVT